MEQGSTPAAQQPAPVAAATVESHPFGIGPAHQAGCDGVQAFRRSCRRAGWWRSLPGAGAARTYLSLQLGFELVELATLLFAPIALVVSEPVEAAQQITAGCSPIERIPFAQQHGHAAAEFQPAALLGQQQHVG